MSNLMEQKQSKATPNQICTRTTTQKQKETSTFPPPNQPQSKTQSRSNRSDPKPPLASNRFGSKTTTMPITALPIGR